ncbi:phosphatidylinositol kinase, partial [Pseudomonas aeruginosa]
CHVASGFTDNAQRQFPRCITQDTLCIIQARIDDNIARLS